MLTFSPIDRRLIRRIARAIAAAAEAHKTASQAVIAASGLNVGDTVKVTGGRHYEIAFLYGQIHDGHPHVHITARRYYPTDPQRRPARRTTHIAFGEIVAITGRAA